MGGWMERWKDGWMRFIQLFLQQDLWGEQTPPSPSFSVPGPGNTHAWPPHRDFRATNQTLSSCELSGPTETQKALPTWSHPRAGSVPGKLQGQMHSIVSWCFFNTLKASSAEQHLQSSSLTTVAQFINRTMSMRASPYTSLPRQRCWALNKHADCKGEEEREDRRGREKRNNIFRWQDKISNCNLSLKKNESPIHSFTGTNMIKLTLRRIRVADGSYANPFLADAWWCTFTCISVMCVWLCWRVFLSKDEISGLTSHPFCVPTGTGML